MRGEVAANVRDGRRRHRRPRASRARRSARIARARTSGALRGRGARHGSEAGSGREFSHRVDRDRRLESRRASGRRWRRSANLPFSVWQAARMLDRAAPAAVFSTGGYVAGPVLLAAVWKRIPIVVMEPNAIPGFTHRHLARFVTRALVSFTEAERWFPQGRSRSHRPAHPRRIFRGSGKAAAARWSRY